MTFAAVLESGCGTELPIPNVHSSVANGGGIPIGYFANDPIEAFAEAGARILLPVRKEWYGEDFDTIFKEVNAYVRKIMVAFGDTVAKK
jgi:hypothetical protein